MVTSVLEDGVIDDREHAQLLAFFDEFSGLNTRPKRSAEDILPETVSGICAIDPSINVVGSYFYLSGESEKCTKSEFSEIIGGRW